MPMGKQRIADGHPEPYKLRYIELGNEEYNNNYVEQVTAMEASLWGSFFYGNIPLAFYICTAFHKGLLRVGWQPTSTNVC